MRVIEPAAGKGRRLVRHALHRPSAITIGDRCEIRGGGGGVPGGTRHILG